MFLFATLTFFAVTPSNLGPQRPPNYLPEAAVHEALAQDTEIPHPISPFDTSRGGTTDPVVAAQDEASHWLALLDQGQYGPSWMDGGSLLKDIITQQQWIGAMAAVRGPYDNSLSRKRVKNNSVSMLPNGTRGNFMILTFDTTFSRNRRANETLIMMTNQQGQWRVISYAIK